MFVVGSRGAGKSSLLRMLVKRLEDSGYPGKIQIFDGKKFFSSADIIRAIESEDVDSVSESSKDRIIVIIDDLDYFFDRSSFDDQYLLRNYLNRESAPLLIATISGIGNLLADYRAPFFEGVRLIYIPPLEKKGIPNTAIGLSAEKQKRLDALMAYLPPVPRSFKIALDILAISDGAETDLRELLDRVSQSYRSRLEAMPVNSQKILCSLADSDVPLSLSELRDITGLPAGTLSTYLRQLVKSGDIRKTMPERRGTPYEMADRLFKLWLSSMAV